MIIRIDILRQRIAGFTRKDAIFTVAALLLVSVLMVDLARHRRKESQASQCKANLQAIALAIATWGWDNDVLTPPWKTPSDRGGNRDLPHELRAHVWFQFAWMSNHLGSPKVLVDPADRRPKRRIATSWGAEPNGGLAHANFQDRACSYVLQLDGPVTSGTGPMIPEGVPAIMLIDRHLPSGKPSACFFTGIRNAVTFEPTTFRWSAEIHGTNFGNLALSDFTVQSASPAQLPELLGRTRDCEHFLFP